MSTELFLAYLSIGAMIVACALLAYARWALDDATKSYRAASAVYDEVAKMLDELEDPTP